MTNFIDWDLVRKDLDAPLVVLAWLYNKFQKEKNIGSIERQKITVLFVRCQKQLWVRAGRGEATTPTESLAELSDSMDAEDSIRELIKNLTEFGVIGESTQVIIDGEVSEKQQHILNHYYPELNFSY